MFECGLRENNAIGGERPFFNVGFFLDCLVDRRVSCRKRQKAFECECEGPWHYIALKVKSRLGVGYVPKGFCCDVRVKNL